MDINDFRTFIEVSRTRHFGQAANNLCITQSAVSARIRQLEEALGKQLFVRQRNNIQLTPEGEQLLVYAETITSAWSRARHSIGAYGKDSVSLVVGGMPGLWDIALQDWLHAVYAQYEQLIIHAEIHGTEMLQRRVLNGTMDLAFVYQAPMNDRLVVKVVSELPLKLVSSEQHRHADEAIAQGYILVDWGTHFLQQHALAFADAPLPILHTDLGRIAFDFIMQRGGSAYLSEPMIAEAVQQGRLYVVDDAPVFERTAYAICHEANDNRALIEDLLDAVPA